MNENYVQHRYRECLGAKVGDALFENRHGAWVRWKDVAPYSRLRYDAIVGSLLVFESDVRSMRDQWKAEDIAEAAAAELAEAPQTSPNKPMVSASQIAADTKDFPF